MSDSKPELATVKFVSEFWKFCNKIHPNLDGQEHPIIIEVVVHKKWHIAQQ